MDDGDNVRWYEMKWTDQDISWIPESCTTNCLERVKECFAKSGVTPSQRPSRLGRRDQKRVKQRDLKKTLPLRSGTSEGKVPHLEEYVTALREQQAKETPLRRSPRFNWLMFRFRDVTLRAKGFVYGKTFPEF